MHCPASCCGLRRCCSQGAAWLRAVRARMPHSRAAAQLGAAPAGHRPRTAARRTLRAPSALLAGPVPAAPAQAAESGPLACQAAHTAAHDFARCAVQGQSCRRTRAAAAARYTVKPALEAYRIPRQLPGNSCHSHRPSTGQLMSHQSCRGAPCPGCARTGPWPRAGRRAAARSWRCRAGPAGAPTWAATPTAPQRPPHPLSPSLHRAPGSASLPASVRSKASGHMRSDHCSVSRPTPRRSGRPAASGPVTHALLHVCMPRASARAQHGTAHTSGGPPGKPAAACRAPLPARRAHLPGP